MFRYFEPLNYTLQYEHENSIFMLSFFFFCFSWISLLCNTYSKFCKIVLIMISVKYDNSLLYFNICKRSVACNYTLHIPGTGVGSKISTIFFQKNENISSIKKWLYLLYIKDLVLTFVLSYNTAIMDDYSIVKNRASPNAKHGSSNYAIKYFLYSRQKLELDVLFKQRFLLFSKNLKFS